MRTGPCRVGSVGSVSASRTVGREFASRPGHTKDHYKNGTKLPPCIGTHALGLEFGSAAQLSKRPGSVWNCLWGNALKRSPGIIRKSRVSYPGPGFLSSATWPSLPKKHYNGLNKLCVQGGMKAVIWTDVFQMLIIMAGMLTLVVIGADRVGGFRHVWRISRAGGRAELIR